MSKITIEKIANYSIMIIALVALLVSIWQVQLFQNHNKLTVKPYLDSSLIQEDSILTVTFSNKGLGPAIIKNMIFAYEGSSYDTLEKLLIASNEKKNTIGSFNYSENSVVSSGEEKLLVKLLSRETRGVIVTIDYETIYEDKHRYQFEF